MKKPVVITLLIVALLLVAAGIGATLWFTIGHGGFSFDENNVSASAGESKTLDAKGAVALKVQDDIGDVTIVGDDVTQITVKAYKTGYGRNQKEAEQALKDIKYEVTREGSTLLVRYEIPRRVRGGFILDTDQPNSVDFTITVPQEMRITVNANFGAVKVSNTKGDADLNSNWGDMDIENLEGALRVKTKSGKVEATSISAGSADIELISGFGSIRLEKAGVKNVTLTSGSGQIEMKDVRATGNMEIASDFGNIYYENGSAASLSVDTESGKVDLIKLNVRGSLTVTDGFGELDLAQVLADSYDLDTGSGAVTVDGAKNRVKAYTDFGDIAIENAQSVTLDLKTNSGKVQVSGSLGEGPHSVKSDFGEITIAIPADSKLNVDLKTDFGGISSDIPLTVTLDGSSDKNHQTGTMNGGGSEFKVSTNSGNIIIEALNK